MNNLIDSQTEVSKKRLEEAVESLHSITVEIRHKELQATVSDVRDRIEDPFMFVIVGEVKAGKSSFINALLDADKEICKVAASPMTDTIQQIVYGESESIEPINQYLKRITQPVEILKDIAIVDTPGTNTIVDHHQEITEKFIPASDLIVFVFESKNPYRQSAWQFFDFIKNEWRKKIIFILQQKDLMQPDDLVTNINGVIEYAIKKGISNPNVFPVSALMELSGEKEESGFKPVRDYIYANITGGKAPFLKLINNAETALNINDKIFKGVILRKEQYESDLRFRNDIKESLNHQEEKTNRQVSILIENLIASYDRITGRKRAELTQGSGVFRMLKRSITSKFGNSESPKIWLESIATSLEADLNLEFKSKLQDGVIDIADSIQNMGRLIDSKIKNSETILKHDHEIFSDIAERRANVLRDLQKAFSGFLSSSDNFYDNELIQGANEIAPNLAKGGGIAIVGIFLTTITNIMVVDVTGGILTAIGFVFAGVTIGLNRSKILKGYDVEVNKGRERIREEISLKLNSYTARIKQKIDDNFFKFDKLLEEEENILTHLESEHNRILEEINIVKADLNTSMNKI